MSCPRDRHRHRLEFHAGSARTSTIGLLDGIAHILRPGQTVAIGSTCRRAVHGEDGLLAVFETLDRHLDPTVRLRGFGVKGPALSHLRAFEHRTITVDSSAFSFAARMSALFNGHVKTNHFVADHMERWTERQYVRLARPRREFQSSLPLPPPAEPVLTGWEAAIAPAREEIRTLVIEGEIAHDQITAGWIAEWAAMTCDGGTIRDASCRSGPRSATRGA